MMRCPPDKAGAYTAVVIVCGIVASIVIVGVAALVDAGPGRRPGRHRHRQATGGAAAGNVTIKAPDGTSVTINPGAMADMAKRMEEAGKRMEEAQKSGDSAAAGKAVGEVMGADHRRRRHADRRRRPEDDAARVGRRPEAHRHRGELRPGDGHRRLVAPRRPMPTASASSTLSITDTGGLAGLATMAGWANMTMDKETDGKVEKVYKDGARTVHEEYHKDGSHGEVTVILANGVIVEADGNRIDVDTLKKVLAGLDLGRIEAMKRPAQIGGRYPCFRLSTTASTTPESNHSHERTACSASR